MRQIAAEPAAQGSGEVRQVGVIRRRDCRRRRNGRCGRAGSGCRLRRWAKGRSRRTRVRMFRGFKAGSRQRQRRNETHDDRRRRVVDGRQSQLPKDDDNQAVHEQGKDDGGRPSPRSRLRSGRTPVGHRTFEPTGAGIQPPSYWRSARYWSCTTSPNHRRPLRSTLVRSVQYLPCDVIESRRPPGLSLRPCPSPPCPSATTCARGGVAGG